MSTVASGYVGSCVPYRHGQTSRRSPLVGEMHAPRPTVLVLKVVLGRKIKVLKISCTRSKWYRRWAVRLARAYLIPAQKLRFASVTDPGLVDRIEAVQLYVEPTTMVVVECS